MPNLNQVILIGRMTRDAELRYTANGTPVCEFGVAINRKWGGKEETVFVDVTAFGKTAETISQHLAKGRHIGIIGRLSLDQWEDREGRKRSKLYVVAERMEFMDPPRREAGEPPAGGPPADDEDDAPF